ncbi:hypothetical protein [Calothrix sp. UHCC 0171]|uniref:hypothetical protein n=1 Tax=Calothrix sp. UHCC 0171 TaxID=3110245 RepID=UPI002B2087C2|nr:hypothetical protein [Calothrix sp. UHCC 0171]MEA5570439.1 hypothetical protein [Calothrix sp. UHCC 0171]
MNSIVNQTIERWVKVVEFIAASELDKVEDGRLPSECFTVAQLIEKSKQIKLEKRNKPSYHWLEDRDGKFYRIWFDRNNLTIQFDLYLSNSKYQSNMSYFDLENCTTSNQFTEFIYHLLGKSWSSPELLLAFIEVIDEASEQCFGKRLYQAFSTQIALNWVKPTP